MLKPLIALIPARADSKGLPGKNWLEWRGKPLVERAVECALECPGIDDVLLSSNDARAHALAQRLGVKFIPRSAAAASDSATANDVVEDVIAKWSPAQHAGVGLIYLQPTSPFRTPQHVADALAAMEAAGAQACVSVVESPISGYKLLRTDSAGLLDSLLGDLAATGNRAELPMTYLANGAIYIFSLASFQARRSIPLTGALPFVMSARDSVDVDTPDDWSRALRMGATDD